MWKWKGTRMSKTILKNKVKVEGLSFPDFKILENGSNQGCSIARGMDT